MADGADGAIAPWLNQLPGTVQLPSVPTSGGGDLLGMFGGMFGGGGMPSFSGGDAGPATSTANQDVNTTMNNAFAVSGSGGSNADARGRVEPVDFGGDGAGMGGGFDMGSGQMIQAAMVGGGLLVALMVVKAVLK
jgi:hypothetical protein